MHLRRLVCLLLPFTLGLAPALRAAPTITTQPANVTVTVGTAVNLSVSATGSGSLSYQWQRNGFPITAATGPTFAIASPTQGDSDYYNVVVTDSVGSTASASARVMVRPTVYPDAVRVDTAFDLPVENESVGFINAAASFGATGQVIVAGDFTSMNGTPTRRIARFNANGALDPTFVPAVDNNITAVFVDSTNNTILIGGTFLFVDGSSRTRLARLNANGTVDSTFTTGSGASSTVRAFARQSDGKYLVGGSFTSFSGNSRNFLARVTSTGAFDSTFNASITGTQINAIVVQPDGKIVIGGTFTQVGTTTVANIARVDATGAIDSTFAVGTGLNGAVNALALDGTSIIAGGAFTSYNGTTTVNRLARLSSTGVLDTAFNSGTNGPNSTVNSIVLDGAASSPKIFIGGLFTTYSGVTANRAARLNNTGTLDVAYSIGGTVNALAYTPTTAGAPAADTLMVAGSFSTFGTVYSKALVRVAAATGVRDSAVSVMTRGAGQVNVIKPVPGGKWLIGGLFSHLGGTAAGNVARLTSSLAVDTTFNAVAGSTGTGYTAAPTVALAGGGAIVGISAAASATLTSGSVSSVIITNAGTGYTSAPSIAFSSPPVGGTAASATAAISNGSVTGITVLAGGSGYTSIPTVTLNGGFTNNAASLLATVNTTTGRITGFSISNPGTGYTSVPTMALSGGGGSGGSANIVISSGSVSSVTLPSGASAVVSAAVAQGDGKIVIGGNFTSYDGTSISRVARLNADGTLDSTFNPSTGPNGAVTSLVGLPGGKVYASGSFTTFNGLSQPSLVRLNTDGSLDSAFNAGTTSFAISAMALQTDGKLVAGGTFTRTNPGPDNTLGTADDVTQSNIVRLTSNGTVDNTFLGVGTGGSSPNVASIAIQPNDDRIVIGGNFTTYDGASSVRLSRLNTNGTLDTTFSTGVGSNNSVTAILPQEDGKLLTYGSFTGFAGQANTLSLARVTTTGLIDPSFAHLGANSISLVTPVSHQVLDDGKMLIGFSTATLGGRVRLGLARLTAAPPATIQNFSASSVRPGATLVLTGTEFLDVTGVRFNGVSGTVAASFTVDSPTQITVTVPAGATSGPVVVQTLYGNAISTVALTVAPDWQLRNPQTTASTVDKIAYGAGKYVLAASSGSIFSSPDGITWTKSFSGPNQLNGVTFAAGMFVAVGNSATVLTSTNGTSWTQQTVLGTTTNLNAVAHDGTKWIVATSSTLVVRSTDGVLWTVPSTTGVGQSNGLAYGVGTASGMFVQVGNSGAIRSSPDGLTWTTQGAGLTTNTLNNVVFKNGQFIIGGSSGTLLTSPDGMAWTVRATGTTDSLYTAEYLPAGGAITTARYIMGVGGQALVSTDNGVTWTQGSGFPSSARSILFAGGQVIASGSQGNIATSPDGTNWTLRASSAQNLWRDIAYGNGRFMGVNDGSFVLTSIDGATFTYPSFGQNWNMNGIGYGNGMFAAVGSSVIATTVDGTTWTNRTPTGTFTLNSVAFGGGVWLAVGPAGTAYRSTDGITWTAVTTTGTTTDFNYVAYGAGTFVAVGANGTIYATIDGLTWNSRTSNVTSALNGVAFVNGQFVAVGDTGTIVTSPTGTTWTTRTSGTSIALRRVAYGDSSYLVVGNTGNNYLISSDAITWAQAFPSIEVFNTGSGGVIAFGNGRFVVGAGVGVLSSTNPASDTPYITTQPIAATSVPAGGTTTLSVAVNVTGSTYQWYRGMSGDTSTPVSGATAATFTTPVASATTSYWVRVTNGTAVLDSATSTVSTTAIPLAITTQPANATFTVGQTATLSVVATGTPGTLTYAWRRNGYVLATQTSATLSIAGADQSDTDNYDVVVSDGTASVTSSVARLTIAPTTYLDALRLDTSLDLAIENDLGGSLSGVVPYAASQFIVFGDFTRVAGNAAIRRVARFNADGSIDAAFAASVNGTVSAVLVLPLQSGETQPQVIIAGNFTLVNGVARTNIARLNGADGSVDTTFNPGSGSNNTVFTLVRQSDGKLILGGSFTSYNGSTANRICRISADGALDTTFLVGSTQGVNSTVNALALDASTGKVYLGGAFTTHNSSGNPALGRIARFNTDGTLDATFAAGSGASATVNALAVDSAGNVMVGGAFTSFNGAPVNRLARISSAGAFDSTFNNTGVGSGYTSAPTVALSAPPAGGTAATAVATFSGGVVTGFTVTSAGSGYTAAPTVTLTGGGGTGAVAATTLGTGGIVASIVPLQGPNNTVNTLAYDAAGNRWILGGAFTNYNGGATLNRLARIGANGALDTTFNPNVNSTVLGAFVQPGDGSVVFAGSFTTVGNIPSGATTTARLLARVTSSGVRDTTVAVAFRAAGTVNRIMPLPGGKLLIGGLFSHINGAPAANLARLNGDLTVDRTFVTPGGSGYVAPPAVTISGVGSGAIVTATLNASGQVNTFTITNGGTGYTATPTVVIAAPANGNAAVATATVTGGVVTAVSLNNSNAGPNGAVLTSALQGDGKIVLGGNFTTYNGSTAVRVARLNADLTLDTAFSTAFGSSGASAAVNAIALIPSGGMYIGGAFTNVANSSPARAGVARLAATGALDGTFNAGATGFTVNALALQPDGKLIAGGTFTTVNGTTANNLVRFTTTGAIDSTFGTGANGQVRALTLLPDAAEPNGKLLVTGDFTSFNGTTINELARVKTSDGSLDPTFAVGTTLNSSVYAAVRQEDGSGKILAFGNVSLAVNDGLTRRMIERLNADGSPDINGGAVSPAQFVFSAALPGALYVLDDGRVLASTNSFSASNTERTGLVRFTRAIAPTVSGLSAAAARPGSSLTITGSNFVDVTAVRFGGLTATAAPSFTVNSPTQITLDVPPSAVTGPVVVQTVSGNASSSSTLTVAPDWQMRNPQTSARSFESGVAFGVVGGVNTYVAVNVSGAIFTSTDGVTWTRTFTSPQGLNAVAFADGKFVAVGNAGVLFTSPNGTTWTSRLVIGSTAAWSGVAHDGTSWLVGANNSANVLTSTDAITWTLRTTTGGISMNALAYGGPSGAKVYVSVGASGAIRSSTDGITWTTQTSNAGTNTLNRVAFVNGNFVVAGNSGTIVTSTDGITWTPRTSGTTSALFGIAYGNVSGVDRYVIGIGTSVLTSSDLATWSSTSISGNALALAFGGGQFVAGGIAGNLQTSPNGTTWTPRNSASAQNFRGVAYGNGRFIVVASSSTAGGLVSTDGVTWDPIPAAGGALLAIAYQNGVFAGVGTNALVTTVDGTSWINQTPSGTSATLNAVAAGNGVFVAVGNSGLGFRSADGGNTWSPITTGVTDTLNGIDYGAGMFVAVGASGRIITSTDNGVTWTATTSGTIALNGIAYLNGQFVVVGSSSVVLTSQPITSAGALTWTARTLGSTGITLSKVAYGDGNYIAVGNSNNYWISTDAVTWTPVTSNLESFGLSTGGTQGLAFGNGRFVATAAYGFVTSTNPAADTLRINTQPPAVASVAAGPAPLSVDATGVGLTYQWYRGFSGDTSNPITGATNALYSATTSDYYWVRVSSGLASVDSLTSAVSGNAPVISLQPINTTLTIGTSGSLSVSVTGTGSITYQWRKYGLPIAGATGATLQFNAPVLSDAGFYDVVVSIGITSVVSAPARVDVNPASYISGALRPKLGVMPRIELQGAGVSAFAVDGANGKIYIGGSFTRLNGTSRLSLARFNTSDGAIDTTYTPVPLAGGIVRALYLQPDGRLIVGGDFSVVNGSYRGNLVRLNTDGTLDTSFDPRVGGNVYAIAKQGTKLIVGGSFTTVNNITANRIARFHNDGNNADGTTDGTLDTSFIGSITNSEVRAIVVQSNDFIVAGGTFTTASGVTVNRLVRLLPGGSLDTNFNINPTTNLIGSGLNSDVLSLATQLVGGEERILVGGLFTSFNGTTGLNRLIRLTSAGALDPSFVTGTGFNSDVNVILVQPDNKIVLGGNFTSYKGLTPNATRIARLDVNGTIDTATDFGNGTGFNSSVTALALQGTQILAGGVFTTYNTTNARDGVARLDGTGAFDATLVLTSARRPGSVLAIEPLPDGKWLVGGNFNFVDEVARNHLARFNADGSFDASFVPGGTTGTGFNNQVNSLAIQGDGKIVAGGSFTSFNNNGTSNTRSRIARLNADGTLDASFGSASVLGSTVNIVAITADGKIVAGGSFTDATRVRIVRFNSDGALDATFVTGAGFNGTVTSLVPQLDGKLVVGGTFTTFDTTNAMNSIARLTATGAFDTTFNPGGVGFSTNASIGGIATASAVLPADQKFVVGGSFTTFNGTTRGRIARLSNAGALDGSYATGTGFNSTITALALQSDGKLVAAGFFSTVNGAANRFPMARISADGLTTDDFTLAGALGGSISVLRFTPTGTLAVGGSRFDFNDGLGSGVFYLLEPASLPVITQQPQSVAITLGNPATFTVAATGEGLKYQWFNDGDEIPGATSATYTIASPTVFDVDIDLYVRVYNNYGSVDSNLVTIAAANPAPTITTQPAPYSSVIAGQNVTLTMAATGANITYIWTKNDEIIPGATNASLTLSNVGLDASGNYVGYAIDGLAYRGSTVARVEVVPATYANGGQVRASFTGRVETTGNITAFASLADGRFYAAGTFTSVDGVKRDGIARFLANGQLDTTWTPPSILGTITALAVQSDDKIVLSGTFVWVGGRNSFRLVRLNVDGSVDTGFNVGSGFSSGAANAIIATGTSPNIKIYLAGAFTDLNDTVASRIIRINEDGSPDATFASGTGFDGTVNALIMDASGGLIAGGGFVNYNGQPATRLARIDAATGSLDTSFAATVGAGFDAAVSGLALKGTQIVAVGPFTTYQGVSSVGLALLDSTGARVAGFPLGTGFLNGTNTLQVNDVAVQPDGKIIVGGAFTTYNGATANRLVRLDGTTAALDAVFQARLGANANTTVSALAVQANGQILVGGAFATLNGVSRVALARLDATGTLDAGVNAACRAPGTVFAIAPVAGGKYLIGGTFTHVNDVPAGNIARIDATGAVDPTFTTGLGFNGAVRTFFIRGDGRIVAGGAFTTYNGAITNRIAELSANGALQPFYLGSGFGNGTVIALAPTTDDNLVAGGTFTLLNGVAVNRIVRFSIGGDPDTAFNAAAATGTGLNGTVNTVLALPDGKVLVGGAFTAFNDVAVTGLLRLGTDGNPDNTFNLGTGFFNTTTTAPSINALVLQPDGRILAGGAFVSYNGTPQGGLVRLMPTGALDSTLAIGLGSNQTVQALALQSDGGILAAGSAAPTVNGVRRSQIVRLSRSGNVDMAFGAPFSLATTFNTLVFTADGALLVGSTRQDFLDRTTSGLTLLENGPLPAIVVPPAGGALQAGVDTATLRVTATGVGPLSYVWKRDGLVIENVLGITTGAKTDTLSFGNFQATNTGTYTVTVTDGTGASVTSAPISVSIIEAAPVITAPLAPALGVVAQAGTMGSLRFTATGSSPTVVWTKDGNVVSGGVVTGNDFHLPRIPWTPADAGLYTATISNSRGSATTSTRVWVNEETGWTGHNPLPSNKPLTTLAIFNNQFLAGGLRGTRILSSDGVTWTAFPGLSLNNLTGYAFGNGVHLLLSTNGFVARSSDGVNWVAGNIGAFEFTQHLGFGHGLFVVTTAGSTDSASHVSKILTSPDGIAWTSRFDFPESNLSKPAFGNGVFLVNGLNGKLIRSTNGLDWTAVPAPVAYTPMVEFANGQFFVSGQKGELFVSNDGLTWSPRSLGTGFAPLGLGYGNGLYVLVGENGLVLTSPNATDWTLRASGTVDELREVKYANGTWVVLNNQIEPLKILTSTDGITWTNTATSLTAGASVLGLATDTTSLIGVGTSGTIVRTTDGTTWSTVPSGITSTLNDIAYGASAYLAVGSGGVIRSSLDGGLTWNPVSSPTTNTLNTVDLLGSLYVCTGSNGTILTSSDGLTWATANSGVTAGLSGAAFGAGTFVAVGNSGTILVSTTGSAWTPVNSGVTTALNAVAFGNNVFVAVGDSGVILTSANGTNWTPAGFANLENYQRIQYSGSQFILSGGIGTMYVSPNGTNWTGRFTGLNHTMNAMRPFLGRVYVGGGFGGIMASAPLAPAIVTQPIAQEVLPGQPVTLRVLAAGSALPVTYQWNKDGAPIGGATNATLAFASAQPADSGNYTVVVTTTAGSVTSNSTGLTVGTIPVITTQPVASQTVVAPQPVTFSVVATGAPSPTFQWLKGTVVIAGATDASFTISPTTASDSGTYFVRVTNIVGSVTSSPADLTVNVTPTIGVPPVSQTIVAGQPVTFSVTANGVPPTTYQWFRDGVAISGATNASYTIAAVTPRDNGASFTVAVTNVVTTVTSAPAILTVHFAPTVAVAPPSLTVIAGAPAQFTATATGNPAPTLQWRKNSNAISGATDATFSLASTVAADDATYDVVATNIIGSATSNPATLTVNFAPVISVQPVNIVADLGGNATFSVTASGKPAPTYQWRKNAGALGGATSASLALTNLVATDAGSYSVVITNSVGNVTSSAATLSFNASIASFSPASATLGSTVTLSGVGFTGATAVKFNGTAAASFTVVSDTQITAVVPVYATSGPITVTTATGGTLTSATSLTIPQGPRIANGSIRATVGTGENALLASFTIEGSTAKSMLIRAVGPGLVPFGVSGAIADPQLAIHDASGAVVASNDNWGGATAIANAASSVGAFTLSATSKDSALLINLNPGTYTARVTGVGATTGEALLEVYETTGTGRAAYLSTRARSSSSVVTGLVVGGTGTTGNKTVLIRAVGAGLGTAGSLANPTLTVMNGSTTVATNDNWGTNTNLADIATATAAVGAMPLATNDSALLLTLAPGSYTVQAGGGSGLVLTEIFLVDGYRDAGFAPALLAPLQDQTLVAGSSITFAAPFVGKPTSVSFQWKKNGTAITGATNESYTVASANAGDAGDYNVTMTNTAGATTTLAATVGVNTPPVITTQPVAKTVIVGQTATFSVTATGFPDPTFQWRRNGLNITDGTAATLTLANVTFDLGGGFDVVVSNAAGSVTSSSVVLTVNPLAPNITSALTASGVLGRGFSYQINANTTQATYGASGLPGGLAIDTATGAISGVPTATGTFNVNLTAQNVSGTSSKTLALTIQPPPPIINSAASSTGRVGTAFSFTIQAVNSPTSFGATGLPGGLTLHTTTGVISGTPTDAGTFTIILSATNATGTTTSQFVLTIDPPLNAPVYSGPASLSGVQNSAFSFTPTFNTSGLTTTYTATGLPSGVSINATTGAITGTPTATGTFTVNLTATSSGGATTVTFTFTVNPPPTAPTISSASLASGTAGTAFSFTLTASATPTSFAAVGLPALGLSLNTGTGVISGTPTAPGTLTLQVSAANGVGTGAKAVLVITINPSPNAPFIDSSSALQGRVGDAFSATLHASNSPTSFAVTSGTLPAGLSLNAGTGAITGTPTQVGTFAVWFAASNSFGPGYALQVTFTILPALTTPVVNSNGTAAGQVGQPFTYQITATNAPTSFGATGLPTSLTLNPSTGAISGIPSEATSTALSISLTATNGDGTSTPKVLLLTIAPAPATPVITSALTASAQVGSAFTYQSTASDAPTSFVALNLPAGLALNSTSGAITGTPTASGTFNVALRAANAAGLGSPSTLVLSISAPPSAPAISSAAAASGKVGNNFTYTITTTGTATSFGITGTLPLGLALNTSTGVISGNPAASGVFTLQLTATGTGGTSMPQALVLNIAPADNAPVITSPIYASATVGQSFSYQITASSSPAFPAAPFPAPFTLDAINLPAGLGVNPSTGLIQGQPSAAGVFTATLVGTNSAGTGPYRDLTIFVAPAATAPTVTSSPYAAGQVGLGFSYAITGTNTPTSFDVLGAPAWMTVNNATGALAGNPTTPGTFTVQLVATNSAGSSNTLALSITIAPSPNAPVVTSTRTASGTVSAAFSYQITAVVPSGAPPVTTYVATGLPAGLGLNATTGVISGTPTQSGQFEITLIARNSAGDSQPVTLILTINPNLQFNGGS